MPLAFATLLIVVEVASLYPQWRKSLSSARTLLVSATAISVVLAFITGYQASSSLADLPAESRGALGQHHAYGRLLLINAGVMLVLFLASRRAIHGKRTMWVLYYLTFLFQIALTVLVGGMGGDLIFDHGIGVKQSHLAISTS